MGTNSTTTDCRQRQTKMRPRRAQDLAKLCYPDLLSPLEYRSLVNSHRTRRIFVQRHENLIAHPDTSKFFWCQTFSIA
jgi:hypothetical protein